MTIAFIYFVGTILAALIFHRLRQSRSIAPGSSPTDQRHDHKSWFASPHVEFVLLVLCWPFALIMAALVGVNKAVGFVHDKLMIFFTKDDDSDVSK